MASSARGKASEKARATGRGRASGKASATEQSVVNAEQCITVAFANIDWKQARHGKNFQKNHAIRLAQTIGSIVAELAPAVLCLCEVGEVMTPLESDNMDAVVRIVREAWTQKDATATEQCLNCFKVVGEPYLTVFRSDLVACSDFRMLHNLYPAGIQPRSAQHFLVRQCATEQLRDDDGIDVVNVHAPSGANRLKASQRKQLLRSLMETPSLSAPMKTLGFARFIIGGDMNSTELQILQLTEELHKVSVCASTLQSVAQREHDDDDGDEARRNKIRCWRPLHARHGDIGLARGIGGDAVSKIASNHDPMHYPYAFRWRPGAQARIAERATEQLSAVPSHPTVWPAFAAQERQPRGSTLPHADVPAAAARQQQEARVSHSAASAQQQRATEQPQSVTTCPKAEGGSAPSAAGKAAVLGASAQQQLHGTTAPVRATQQQQSATTSPTAEAGSAPTAARKAAALAASAEQQLHGTTARVHATEQQQSATTSPTAEAGSAPSAAGEAVSAAPPVPGTAGGMQEDDPGDESSATEPRPPESVEDVIADADRARNKDFPRAIVQAFMEETTELNDADEEAMEHALADMEGWASDTDFKNIKEMFESIFIFYPGGLQDRTVMIPRDAVTYIRAWRWLAYFRRQCGHEVDWWPTRTTGYLCPAERQGVFQTYLAHFRVYHFRRVPGKNHNMKSQAEARLRRIAGSRIAAQIIWEIGMPQKPRALATEQPRQERRHVVHEYATFLVHWLAVVAYALKRHKHMSHYDTAVKRSGTVHGESPLTSKEIQERAEYMEAMHRLRRGSRAHAAHMAGCRVTGPDWYLMQEFQSGGLNRVFEDIRRRRGDRALRLGILVP